MPSDATIHSYNTELWYYNAAFTALGQANAPIEAAANWTTIGCIHNISGPDVNITATNSSCLTSAAATMTFIPGMVDTGSVTFTIDYTDDDEETIAGLYRLMKWWRITFPDGGRDVFAAFVTHHTRNVPFDDRITMDVTLKLSGEAHVSTLDVAPAD